MKTLVIQSSKNNRTPDWIDICMGTVRLWAKRNYYDYRFVGDEIFDLVPNWYIEKVKEKLPVATDYGRLILLQMALESEYYDRAIWLDADILICDQALSLDSEGSCAFGQEVWVHKKKQVYRTIKNVHNAVCVFKRGCPVLPFLIQTVESIIRRVNPDKIPPQMVGPKLLTALHNIAAFSLLPQVGALSPEVVNDVIVGGGKALDMLKFKSSVQLQAANLCASLIDEDSAGNLIEKVLSNKSFYSFNKSQK